MHQDASEFDAPPPQRVSAVNASSVTSANVTPDPSVNLPMRGNPSLVLISAIVAGAVSAAIAIFALSHCRKHSEDDTRASASAPERADMPLAASRVESNPAVDAGAAPLPVGVEPSREEPSGEPSTPHHHARPNRPPQRTDSLTSTEAPVAPAATPDPSRPPTPMEIMGQARDAMRANDFDGCVTLARDAQRAGAPSAALRIEGDCLRRSGHNTEALQAYQRFCRVAPDHPAISEVRALADSLGGTCP